MAEDRSEQYLKIVKDGKVVNVGAKGTKKASITGEPANTKVAKGKYKASYDEVDSNELSQRASELRDVSEFTTQPIKVTDVSLDKTTLSLDTGKTGQLKATVAPANATDKTVVWSSTDGTVATADNGKVVAKKAGKTTIKATTKDGNKVAQCGVTVTNPVVHPASVSLDKSEVSVQEGATAQLKATVKPDNATNKGVNWKSGNEATFTIDGNGKITGVKAGQATAVVTTKDGSKTAECKVTVTAKPAPEPPAEGE